MADDKSKTGTSDDIRVDKNDPNEVRHLQEQFPDKQHSQIMDAIEVAGPMREAIVRYLQGKA